MTGAVTIRGAGVVGLCVASELMARGISVTLRDPAPAPGAHGCSWWAGGMLAPFCEGVTAEEPVMRLGQEAADWWEAQGVEVIRRGSLVVTLARDRRELDQVRAAHHRPQVAHRRGIGRVRAASRGSPRPRAVFRR